MYLSPDWFFGYDIVLEILFAIVTFIVSLLAFKVYKSTSQKQAFYLGWSFMLISISNIFQSIINFLIITKLNENICGVIRIQSVEAFNAAGMIIHMFFMIAGLSVLAFMTLRLEDYRGLVLIAGLALIAVFLSANPLYMFYAVSSLLLVIISWYFIRNFLRNKQTKTLLIAIAFLFLLFGSVHFLFSVNHALFYAIGHFLELIAYSLVLSNFFMVLKR